MWISSKVAIKALDLHTTSPAYHSAQQLASMAACEDQVVPAMPVQGSEYPPNWKPQVSMIETFSVGRNTSEWNGLEQRVRETLQDAKISKILRIQNKWLWDRFAVHKKRMQYKNSSYTNEKDLFHGTRGRDPKLIYEGEEGFDMRFSAQGKWGLANYFALNASYADRYAHQTRDGFKEIFLVYVLTGYSYECAPNPKLRMPPQMPQEHCVARGTRFNQQRYDTVTGETGGSRVYMTFDNDKSYPAYVITYSTS